MNSSEQCARFVHPSDMPKNEAESLLRRLRTERARLEFTLKSIQDLDETARKKAIEDYRSVNKILLWAESPKEKNEIVKWSRRSPGVFESEIAGSLYVVRSAEMDSHGGRKKKVWWLYKDGALVTSCSWKHSVQSVKDWLARELETKPDAG